MDRYTSIPHFQIRHNAILLYSILDPVPPRRPTLIKKNRVKAYQGQFSTSAISRLKKAIDIMMMTNETRLTFNPISQKFFPFRFNFITLTISDVRIRSARECYDLVFKPFLRAMRDKFKSISYIWKMELQKRGQPHYHLTTNIFIDYGWIKAKWNQLQRKAGYLENYAYRTGHYHANSTDVHAVKNISNWAAYMSKYMTKNVGGIVNAKIWDCSTDLKRARFSDILNSSILDNIHDNARGHFEFDKCELFLLDSPVSVLSQSYIQKFEDWLKNRQVLIKAKSGVEMMQDELDDVQLSLF